MSGLHDLCAAGDGPGVAALLAAGADREEAARFRRRPLHVAAKAGHADVLRLLLDADPAADVLARTQHGHSAAYVAAQFGHAEAVAILASKGADVDAADQGHMRPLHIACRNGHRDAVAALLDAGADAWAVDNIPWTPLHWLAKDSNLEVAQLLLERAPPASASAQAAAREALALFADHGAARRLESVLSSTAVK